MKIALASKEFVNKEVERNLRVMLSAMAEAKAGGAELVCFGEAFLQGFDSLAWDYETDRATALGQDSPIIKRICDGSASIGIDTAFGYIEREGELLYSSYMLIKRGDIAYNYRRISEGWKNHWITDGHYVEGERPIPFDYRGRNLLVALCGDLWDHPERFALGEELLLWPLYVDYSVEEWRKETAEYAAQAAKCCRRTLFINSICRPMSVGGCFLFENGEPRDALLPGNDGLLFVEC